MEQTFHLQDIVKIFLKRIKLLIIVPVLFAITGFSISHWLISPVYEAKVDLLINNTVTQQDEKFSTIDIETNLRLIETYQYIIQSDRITSLVADKLNHAYSNKQLQDKLDIETNQNSQIMQLSVKDHDLSTAVKMVNLYAETFQGEIKSLMNMENIMILTKADQYKHKQPIMPKPIFITVISFFIGFLISSLYIAVINFFFLKVSSKQDIEKYIALPFIGAVGKIKQFRKRKKKSDTLSSALSVLRDNSLSIPILEAYRTIRTNLDFQMKKENLSTLLITSTVKGEGKTITAANIARMMALNHHKTLLIDADLRKERQDKDNQQLGLSHYLSLEIPIKEVVQPTGIANLYYMAPGHIPQNPAELIASNKMEELLAELKGNFDRIIIDSPPLFFADPLILSTKDNGCLVVTQADKTKVASLQQAMKRLNNVNAHLIGIVLNNKRLKKQEKKFYNYYGSR